MVKDETSPIEEDKAPGVRLTPYFFDPGVSAVDITLEVHEKGEDISFILIYCTKLFKRETMERLMNQFKNILTKVTENRDILLKDIDIPSGLDTAKPIFKVDAEDFDF